MQVLVLLLEQVQVLIDVVFDLMSLPNEDVLRCEDADCFLRGDLVIARFGNLFKLLFKNLLRFADRVHFVAADLAEHLEEV